MSYLTQRSHSSSSTCNLFSTNYFKKERDEKQISMIGAMFLKSFQDRGGRTCWSKVLLCSSLFSINLQNEILNQSLSCVVFSISPFPCDLLICFFFGIHLSFSFGPSSLYLRIVYVYHAINCQCPFSQQSDRQTRAPVVNRSYYFIYSLILPWFQVPFLFPLLRTLLWKAHARTTVLLWCVF